MTTLSLGKLAAGAAAATMALAACGSPVGSSPAASISPPAPTTTAAPSAASASPSPMTTRQAPARASARTAGNGAAACSEDWLRVQKTSEDGAAGHIHFVVAVTNGSATACTLSGYPTFEMLDQGGKTLPTRVTHSDVSFPSSPPHKVLLAPRASASFDVGYSHVPVDPETSCPSASALLVRVTTEGKGLRLSQSMDPCNHGTVATSALKAGRKGTRG